MRAFLRGLVAGSMLSCLRAALGAGLLEWGAVGARTSYGWRTAAIAAVAIGLWSSRQAALPVRFLLGACAGFGLHGLLLANSWSPGGNLSLALVACAGLLLLAAIRPSLVEREPEADAPKYLEMVGLAAAAAGAAIALESIARHARLYEGGLAQDDTVSALVCLAALAFGAAAFGWIATSRALRGLALPITLAASGSACLISLIVVSRLSVPPDLVKYLKHFGLDTSFRGTPAYDALISGACFVAPALILGAGLSGAYGRSRLFATLLGGAVGLFLVPALLAQDPGASASAAQPSSAELVPLGSLVAAGGALLAILSLSQRGAIARWSGIAACLALGAPSIFRKVEPVHVLSPWSHRPVFPLFVADAPEGLVTVESFGLLGGSWLYVTLDRRPITPEFEGAVADAMRLRASLELLPADRRARGELRMLLVGQLTPERARILTDAGVVRVDRTAAWWSSMARLEDALWSALPGEFSKPAGEVLDPAQARDRLGRGDYDLVVAPPVPGDAPRSGSLSEPESTLLGQTIVVRWLELDEPAVQLDLGDRVALVLDGLERPAVAVAGSSWNTGEGTYAPLLLRAGTPRKAPTPLAWLLTRPVDRDHSRALTSRAAMMARLAAAERGGPFEDLMTGFELFFDAQSPSSQFENQADRVELPDDCLDRFRAAALAERALDPTLRRTWETLAQVLTGKRWIEKIYTYVLPVAERHRPWPALEKALARADLESLEPREALLRLEPLKASSPDDFEVWFLAGEAECAAGDGPKALESWKRALWLETSDRYSKRKLTIALARSGDAEGLEAARQMLLETHEDEELKALLSAPDPVGARPDPCAR